ncbi:hypothetical protein [Fervidibacter sp.]|jgi:hypothetical protein
MSMLTGIVKGGVIVLDGGIQLPEGTKVRVEILEATLSLTPEEEEEFSEWERASDKAWELIEQEEDEPKP